MAEIYDRNATTAGHRTNWAAVGIVIAIVVLAALLIAYAMTRG